MSQRSPYVENLDRMYKNKMNKPQLYCKLTHFLTQNGRHILYNILYLYFQTDSSTGIRLMSILFHLVQRNSPLLALTTHDR